MITTHRQSSSAWCIGNPPPYLFLWQPWVRFLMNVMRINWLNSVEVSTGFHPSITSMTAAVFFFCIDLKNVMHQRRYKDLDRFIICSRLVVNVLKLNVFFLSHVWIACHLFGIYNIHLRLFKRASYLEWYFSRYPLLSCLKEVSLLISLVPKLTTQ